MRYIDVHIFDPIKYQQAKNTNKTSVQLNKVRTTK